MATMNISLPDDMKDFVDEQVRARGYMSASEYIRDLVRRQKDVEAFRAVIQEGIDSGPSDTPHETWITELLAKYPDTQ